MGTLRKKKPSDFSICQPCCNSAWLRHIAISFLAFLPSTFLEFLIWQLWCTFTQSRYPCFPCDYTFYWHLICLSLSWSLEPKLGTLTWTWMIMLMWMNDIHQIGWNEWMHGLTHRLNLFIWMNPMGIGIETLTLTSIWGFQ
jgi:hypothetical protein